MELEFDDYDYYDILNVPPNATPDEIKSSYRKLIRLWHPDKHPSSFEFPESVPSPRFNDGPGVKGSENEESLNRKRDSAFTKIQKAYSVLSDPILRGQYDKYGHEGATLAKLIMNENAVERTVYSIPEDLSENNTPKQEILNFEENENYVSKRVFLLLRDRYAREMKMLPFQVVTNYTFNARSDLFEDETMFKRKKGKRYMGDVMLGKRYLYLTGVSLDNSLELLYKKYRFGVSLSSVLARGTFGSFITRFYFSKELSENLELRVTADTADLMSPRMLLVSLKKKFNDTLWSTFILTLSNRLVPNLYAIFHKNINKRHSVELTITNGLFLNYSYLKVLNKYSKVNLKLVMNPDNMGIEMRTKTINIFGTTLGALIRLCLMNGLTFEWFFRTFAESTYLGVTKVEYRLCLTNNKVILVLKGIVNNSKVTIPILIYKGDPNQAVYLVSSLTVITLLIPLVSTAVRNLYYNVQSLLKKTETDQDKDTLLDRLSSILTNEEDEVYKNALRNNFYLSFPQFSRSSDSFVANSTDNSEPPNYELRHIKYYHYPPLNSFTSLAEINKQFDDFNSEDQKQRAAEEEELNLEHEANKKIATDENSKLYNIAKVNYFRELEKRGLLVLLALYGHPKVVQFVAINHASLNLNPADYSNYEPELDLFFKNSEQITNDYHSSNYLRHLRAKHVLNVTNILMSRVNNSTLHLSSNNKDNLIGFFNPCKTLQVQPKLLVIYKYGNDVKAVVVANNQPLLIP